MVFWTYIVKILSRVNVSIYTPSKILCRLSNTEISIIIPLKL